VLLAYAAAFACIPLLLVLPHELGHAFSAVALGAKDAHVVVGGEPRPLRVRLGRLTVEARPFNTPRWVWYGTARGTSWGEDVSHRALIVMLACGPLVSLGVGLAYGWVGGQLHGFLRAFFWFLAAGGLWTFVVTALPIRYGRFFGPFAGHTSDGRKILELARRGRGAAARL
jgi:hypothetical protein